eukprot:8202667-Pyramimonas_sp.AAC.1
MSQASRAWNRKVSQNGPVLIQTPICISRAQLESKVSPVFSTTYLEDELFLGPQTGEIAPKRRPGYVHSPSPPSFTAHYHYMP